MAISRIASKMVGAGLKAAKNAVKNTPKTSKSSEIKEKTKDIGNEFLTNDDSPVNVKIVGKAALDTATKIASQVIQHSHSNADDGSQDNPLHHAPLHHDDI